MTAIAHTLISLPFAFYLENPLIIFLAAAVMHLLLDTLLHWNFYPSVWGRAFYLMAVFDVATALFLAWFFTGDALFTLPVLAAIAGGNAPDIAHFSWEILNKKTGKTNLPKLKRAFKFHENLQLETKSFELGIIWQVILIVVAIVMIS